MASVNLHKIIMNEGSASVTFALSQDNTDAGNSFCDVLVELSEDRTVQLEVVASMAWVELETECGLGQPADA